MNDLVTLEVRFWSKVHKCDGCWEWTGGHMSSGYGAITKDCDEGMLLAHRVSWELHYGPIPQGLCVCHHCDNKICVRPDHLFLGTHLDNTRDMVAKGRATTGERQKNSKLTEAQVMNIRRLYADGKANQYELAQQFGVNQAHISNIVRRTRWSHLE